MVKYYEVDVFGVESYSGNPVGVVMNAGHLTTEEMQAFARWKNLSETTFVLPSSDQKADYRLRIFTPTTELPFAGHPTLGSARAWLEENLINNDRSEIIQECGVGLVQILQRDGILSFKAPDLIRDEPLTSELYSEVASVLNISKESIVDAKWIDNGPGWIGVLLSSAQEVLEIIPQRNSKLALGVFGFYDSTAKYQYEVRAFYPEDGLLVEDPATGSLHASGAQWLVSTGKCNPPYLASQGRILHRNAEIRVQADANSNIWVGGSAITKIKGDVII